MDRSELSRMPLARLLQHAVERHRLQATSERYRSELVDSRHELAGNVARFRLLAEHANDVLYRVSLRPDFGWDYVSPAVESLTGYDPHAFSKDPGLWSAAVHPDDRPQASALAALEERGMTVVVYRFRRADGTWIWVEDRRTAIYDGTRMIAVQGICRDVSDRHEAEQAMERALEHERQAVAQLRTVDEIKTAFLRAVSHELRTPLTLVRGFAQTLRYHDTELKPDKRLHLLERLNLSAEKLNGLLSDLLDVDRLERGLTVANRRPTAIAALIRGTVEDLHISTHPIHIQAPDDLVVPVDAPKVQRIVDNLVANAVRHTPGGTTIEVTATGDECGIRLSVRDHGPGVPEGTEADIWQAFAQGGRAAGEASPGIGIGLTLVSQFARLHGGRAWVEHPTGGGARFLVELPAESTGISSNPVDVAAAEPTEADVVGPCP